VLPYASTADAARDMDVIRAALGAPRLSYLGYSYGSYLGALYTQMFPGHTGRIVLDSAIDPAHPGIDKGDNGPEREAALGDWASWAAQRDSTYHLGSSAVAVLSTVHNVYAVAARRPLRVGAYRVDDTLVPGLLLDPLSDDSDDSSASLATTVQVLAAAAAGDRATPTPELATRLAGLLTGVNSALASAQTGIMCADAAVPADPDFYFRRVQAHRASAPLFSPIAENISPCAFWPARPTGAPPRVHNTVPALIVHADGDINATAPLNEAMHAALTGSRMITLTHTRTHGVYLFRGSSCVDDAVNGYLATGTLPAADMSC
jgi:pimeloyl-ACP methyl ester carboxylesterase